MVFYNFNTDFCQVIGFLIIKFFLFLCIILFAFKWTWIIFITDDKNFYFLNVMVKKIK